MPYASILDTIGRTPLIRLNRLSRGLAPEILVKADFLNPGGSVKDRIAVTMIDDAERCGLLKPGGTIIEGTSGNTGFGLALVAAVRGYKCIFTITDKQSREKIDLLKALGADVIVCPTAVEPDDPRSYYSVARKLAAEIPNSHYPNQYDNPANPRAHYESTGPEIWEETQGRVTHFVAGMGTGGTISGTGRYLKEQNGAVRVIGVDPVGSVYHRYFHEGEMGEALPYVVEGIGEDILPKAMDFSVLDDVVQVTDKECFQMTRRLSAEEGLFTGGSCGAAVQGGLEVARTLGPDDVMVIFLTDSGLRYLSKIYNDGWMREHRYLENMLELSAEQILEHRSRRRDFLTASPSDSLRAATEKMRKHDVSQLPVCEDGRSVGALLEDDVVNCLLAGEALDDILVRTVMTDPFPVLAPTASIDEITALIPEKAQAVLVERPDGFDILTKYDVVHAISV